MYTLTILLLSALNFFPAPAYILWLTAILIGEFAVYFILITLLIVLAGLKVKRFAPGGTIAGLAACLFLSWPVISSATIASSLNSRFRNAFPKSAAAVRPFSLNLLRLFALQDSKQARFQTITYTSEGLTMDFYSSPGKSPCVLVVHGGSWSSGDSQQLPGLNSLLASKGYAVASMNYRLAPASKSPAPLEDVKRALGYLSSHSARLGIDTSEFVLLGRSAGSQIALLAAYTLNNRSIKGVIDFYGPADMVWGYSKPSNPLVLNSRKVMEDYLGGTYRQVPASYKASSPIEYAGPASTPTLILHGENDALVAVEHSRRLNLKLQRAGVKHFLLDLPWATHGFDFNLNGPGGQLSTYLVLQFLDTVTSKAQAKE